MTNMNAIGGYFELELLKGEHYHKDAIRLNSGRNCFEYILLARCYKKVYMPYYTCQIMFDMANQLGIEIERYHINEQLEPVEIPELIDGEAFLYTNYYGLKQRCVERLAEKFGQQLIVDNAQAFYAVPLKGIDTFYSPRKFFGVPDGGYLYTDAKLGEELPQAKSIERFSHLLQRIEDGAEAGYNAFVTNGKTLQGCPIERMSRVTEALLGAIDYSRIRAQRIENYKTLDKYLKETNKLNVEIEEDAVPMVYPYLTKDETLRSRLISQKIFVAAYWPNVEENNSIESTLRNQMYPIPIDQRYGEDEMKYIANTIGRYTGGVFAK